MTVTFAIIAKTTAIVGSDNKRIIIGIIITIIFQGYFIASHLKVSQFSVSK